MCFALNQRNLSITEASSKSSRMANLTAYSEWSVNLQVTTPVQVKGENQGKKFIADGL